MTEGARVISVNVSAAHAFSKPVTDSIHLVEGRGVEGDAHFGIHVKHRSRVAKDPTQPNHRQVHLIHSELFEELARRDHTISAGDLGENITTKGLDLLSLCELAQLHFSRGPIVEVTGLRNPCAQIETFRAGLLSEVLERDAERNVVRKAGVMGIVIRGGEVRPGDGIRVVLPQGDRRRLEVV